MGAIHQAPASNLRNSCVETCPGSIIWSCFEEDQHSCYLHLHFTATEKDPERKPSPSGFILLLLLSSFSPRLLPLIQKRFYHFVSTDRVKGQSWEPRKEDTWQVKRHHRSWSLSPANSLETSQPLQCVRLRQSLWQAATNYFPLIFSSWSSPFRLQAPWRHEVPISALWSLGQDTAVLFFHTESCIYVLMYTTWLV